MRADLLDRLVCPMCRAPGLTLHHAREVGQDIASGEVHCRCGARFPIDRHVLSCFDQSRTTEADARMLADGEYWSSFYVSYEDLGYRYFVDSRTDVCPLLFQGILRPLRLGRLTNRAHWHEPHYREFLGPRVLGAVAPGDAFEAGCGAGWLTLELARRGFRAIGQDTALEALVRAKRQALAEGVAADYVHASSLRLPLAPASLDLFVAFQALHHFEELPRTLADVHVALRPGAAVAIFEHRRTRPPKLHLAAAALDRVCLPLIRWRWPPTARADWTASPAEDTATVDMDAAIGGAFAIEREVSYLLFLQQAPPYVYYLLGESPRPYVAASALVNAIDRLLARRFPDKAEHRIYVGRRRSP